MRAVIYVRQSLDRTGEGLGVTRQRQDCEKLCTDRGWTIIDVITDNDTSASSRRPRPGWARVLQLVRDGSVDVVVAWHVDRLLRRMVDLEELIELCEAHGAKLSTVSGDLDTGTDAGRLVARMLAAVARGEVERKSARQKRAVDQAAAAGRRVGGRKPFGYAADGVQVVPEEAAAVVDGYEQLLAGVPLAAIARDWNTRGLHAKPGYRAERAGVPGEFRPDSVRQILTNPRYAGLRAHRGQVVGEAVWPALVGRETWAAAVAVLSDPTRRKAGRSKRLLSRIASCGVCGAYVHGGGAARRNVPGYRCSHSLGHVARMAEPVDEYVASVVVERLSRPDAATLLRPVDAGVDVAGLRAEALEVRRRLDVLADQWADGSVDDVTFRRAQTRLRARADAVDAKLVQAGRVDAAAELVAAQDAHSAWVGMGLDRQRAVLEGVLASVVVHPPGRGVRTFRPETVEVGWRHDSQNDDATTDRPDQGTCSSPSISGSQPFVT